MFKHQETKKLFDLFSLNDNYKYDSHIANGVDTDFYYLEFEKKSLTYYEMNLALLREESIFYEQRIHQAICGFSGICGTSNGSTATENDIDNMKRLISDVLRDINGYKGKGSWCSQEEREDGDPNNIVVGYYLNHKWQSNDFPKELIDKIFSADKYITLISKGLEVMMILEHSGKHSLFYSMNDQ